jgi:hypothetical protein
MIRKLMVKILKAAQAFLIALDMDPRLKRTIELVGEYEGWVVKNRPARGSEKRDKVLSTLAHEFPQSRIRDLAYMIEAVVQARSK